MLLKEIVVYELVDAKCILKSQATIWKLTIFDDASRCSNAAVEFMVSFLRKHELSSSNNASSAGGGVGKITNSDYGGDGLEGMRGGPGSTRLTQRERLLEWLCRSLSKEMPDPKRMKNAKSCGVVPPYLAVAGLLSLFRSGAPPPLTRTPRIHNSHSDPLNKTGGGKLRRAFDEDDFYHFGALKEFDGTEFIWLPHVVGKYSTFGNLGLGWIGTGSVGKMKAATPNPLLATELRLAEIEHSRALYTHSSAELRIGASDEGQQKHKPLLLDASLAKGVGIPRNHVGKNHISTVLRMRMQNTCVRLLKDKADNLLEMGASVFGAQKRKTLGINKDLLTILISEMVSHCHVIVDLLHVVLDAPSALGNKGGEAEEARLKRASGDFSAIDEMVFMPLINPSLNDLIDFISECILQLSTQPAQFFQVLSHYDNFVTSWKSADGVGAAPLSKKKKKTKPKAKGDKEKEKDDMEVDDGKEDDEEESEKEGGGGKGDNRRRQNGGGEDEGISPSPLAPFCSALYPVTKVLMGYLREYAAAAPSLARTPVASLAGSQIAHPTAAPNTILTDDLDLLDIDVRPSAATKTPTTQEEDEEEDEDIKGEGEGVPASLEGAATFTDENVTLCVRIVGRSALYALCESEQEVGKVLIEVLQATHNVQLKFEIIQLLLDMCRPSSSSNSSNSSSRGLHDDDEMVGDNEEDKAKTECRLDYVRKTLKATQKMAEVPELFGQDIVRRHILWVLQRLISLLNPKVNNIEREREREVLFFFIHLICIFL